MNISGLAGLKLTLQTFYQNYNAQHREDIMIVHDGDFDLETQGMLIEEFPELLFFKLEGENWKAHPADGTQIRFGE